MGFLHELTCPYNPMSNVTAPPLQEEVVQSTVVFQRATSGDNMKQDITVETVDGTNHYFEQVFVQFGGAWLTIEEEYTESELAPLPKRRFLAAFPTVNVAAVFPNE